MARFKRPEEPSWGDPAKLRVINTDVRRVDGPEKVSGRARYTHDIRLPGMAYARLLCCPHPAAEYSLDLEAARAVPGVLDAVAVRAESGKTSWLGQPIAAVAAETPEAAEDGLRAIGVEYTELDWVVTHEQSIAEGAPQVGSRGNVTRRRENTEGDLERGFEESDVVIEHSYRVPVQHHACLETHGHLVDYRGGDQATVHGSVQYTFALPEAAEPLGLEEEQVEGSVQHMGGGFGSKFGIGTEGRMAAVLAKRLERPVQLMLKREDEFLMGGNRSGNLAHIRAGASADGTLKALDCESSKHGGVGGGSYPGQPYVYEVENWRSVNQSVHTHTDSSRAMRAPGHPQASFAIESVIDELAYGIGMDPLEFRKQNLASPYYHRQLDRCAQEIGWASHPNRTQPGSPLGDFAVGIGFGVATWGGGGYDVCKVEARIGRDGVLVIESGTQDLGTGTRTLVAAIGAEEFGLPVSAVTARIGRTIYGNANLSGGSMTAACLSPSVKDAVHNLREAFAEHLAPLLGAEASDLVFGDGAVQASSDSAKRLSWAEACAALPATGLAANGEFVEGLQNDGIHGAQAVAVRVDLLTGAVQPLKMVCVQDCGLPINRLALRSQINGGMVMALSFGLLEQRVIDPWLGLAMNAGFEDYKLLGPQEMPEMVAIIDDHPESLARGVIGIGEPPAIPGHAALGNAIYNACGARLYEMPFTPDKVLNALVALRAGGESR